MLVNRITYKSKMMQARAVLHSLCFFEPGGVTPGI